jgi:hypothetical protein
VLAALDSALLRALRTRGHSPAAEAAALAVSRFGEHGAGWIALALGGVVVVLAARGALAGGKVRALAVTSAQRLDVVRDLPTVAESGVPGYDVATWESIQAPAGTPADVIAKLNAAVREVVASKDVRQKMINLGFEPDGMKSPTESAQFVRSERAKWAKVVRERNIKVE